MLPHHPRRRAAAVSTLLAAVTIALAGLPARAVAADYLWPTDASRCVTGGLCEFRPGHFHSGIDISTQGMVGFKAIAVADGDVVRARVTCGGYGRALYLRLADGRTAVYAHLSRFAGAVGDSIRTRQLDAGDAYLDVSFPPGRFPVKAGDTVAWTGQSGVGVPHLHFEIRDEAERPLDPLREGFGVPDTTPPVPLRLALTPLDATSSVDGRADTMVYDVIPDGANHEGRLARTIPVEGEIGVALEIDESTNACKFRLAPARLELREGEERIYAVDYRGFAFSQSAQQDYQIDPRFSYSKIGRFHRVYLCAGNELPVVEDLAGRGGVLRAGRGPAESRRLRRAAGDTADSSSAFPLAPSVQVGEAREREYTVEIEDAAGNRGRVTFTLSFGAPPEVAALSLFAEAEPDSEPDPWAADLTASWADTLTVIGAVREGGRPLDRVHLDWSPDGGVTWFDEPDATIRPDGSFRGQIAIAGRIPGQGRASVVVRAQPVDRLGAVGLARSVAPDGAEAPPPLVPTFEVVTHGGFVELRFAPEFPWNAVSGGWEIVPATGEEAAVLVRALGPGVRVMLDARPALDRTRVWTGLGAEWKGIDAWGRPVAWSWRAPAAAGLGPGEITAASEDSRAAVIVPATCIREPAIPLVRSDGPPPSGANPELVPLGDLYVADFGQVLALEDWRAVLRPADAPPADGASAFDPERVAVFVQEGDRFRYLGADRQGDREWTVETRTVLPFGLFEDRVPPTIGPARLVVERGEVHLAFLAEDQGAGLDCDGVTVRLDGARIAQELDDETGDVIALVPFAPESGRGGTFEIVAVDRCGNETRKVVEARLP